MNFTFLVKCDKTSGLGHIYRSLSLIQTLTERDHKCHLITSFTGLQIASSVGYKEAIFSRPDWVVVDQVGALPKMSDQYKMCFLDATGDPKVDGKAVSQYNLVVCGGIPSDTDTITDKWLVGFDYVLLWYELRGYTNSLRKKQVFLYLSVYHKEKKAAELDARLYHSFSVVPPPVITMPQRGDHWLAGSCVAIAPWGMTACEAMYLGIPCISFNQNPYAEKSFAKAVESKAVIPVDFDSPNFASNAMSVVSRIIDLWLKKDREYDIMSEGGRKLIDGRGCERVAKRLEELSS